MAYEFATKIIKINLGNTAYIILALVFSMFISCLTIWLLLKKDEDAKSGTFPPDFATVFSFLIYFVFFYISYQNSVSDIKSFILVIIYLSMLFISAYIDLRTKYIFDMVLIISGAIFFVFISLMDQYTIKTALISMFIGAAFYGVIYVVSRLIYKKEAFGQGDIFLMAVSSMFLEPMETVLAGFLSFYIAAIFILIFALINKKEESLNEIPFGPYICLSSLIMFNYGNEIMDFIHRFI